MAKSSSTKSSSTKTGNTKTRRIRKVLIANRGEIAVRVARTLREMGIASVAVYSEADAGAPHVEACDEAIAIGPAPASESYLVQEKILAAARDCGADAVHPGYGFLSERASFAEACEKAGIAFIGPGPAAIRLMGSKDDARRAAEKAGVPVVPGSKGALADDAAILAVVNEIGVPVMLKAAAGGGGKGMRRIESAENLSEQVESARREAEASFGDGALLVEKLVSPARHVEIQIIGDQHGNVLALGERECSLQRRFQKIIEEAPSAVVDAKLRDKMQTAACDLARAAGYAGAGTVEFLLQDNGTFYFLEMNTRLQVEHPVTELVMGVDLVRMQIEVAEGHPLAIETRAPRGHAIEARLYAENPDAGFLPTSGPVLALEWPEGARVDHGLREGMEIGTHYDPMLAKVIVWGHDREQARVKLIRALEGTILLGFVTNVNYLIDLLSTDEFRDAKLSIDRLPEVSPPAMHDALFAAAAASRSRSGTKGRRGAGGQLNRAPGPWDTIGRWRVGE